MAIGNGGISMVGKIKIGIIGSGGIAESHARSYQAMDEVEIIGIADVVAGKAQQFIDKLNIQGAKAFENHTELLELELDAVSICVPNVAHYQTSIDALKAGKHVLVEKPLSVTLEQGIEMVEVSKEIGKMLSVGFQPRYDPNMKKLNEIVQSGQLGDVYYIEVGGGRRRGMPGGTFINKSLAGAGAMADIGTYSLDLALNALGHPKPLTVSAYISNHFGTNPDYHPEADKFEVEDFGVAMIRLEGGIILNFKISWAMHMDSLGPAIFLGKKAGLKLTNSGQGPWSGVWDGGLGSMSLFYDEGDEHIEKVIPIEEHSIDVFDAKIRDFVLAIKDGGSAPIPAEEILSNQAIIDGIFRSAELGREVEVNLPNFE